MAKKAPKKRAKKYEGKLSIDGTFADVIKVSVQPGEKKKTPAKKTAPKKK